MARNRTDQALLKEINDGPVEDRATLVVELLRIAEDQITLNAAPVEALTWIAPWISCVTGDRVPGCINSLGRLASALCDILCKFERSQNRKMDQDNPVVFAIFLCLIALRKSGERHYINQVQHIQNRQLPPDVPVARAIINDILKLIDSQKR